MNHIELCFTHSTVYVVKWNPVIFPRRLDITTKGRGDKFMVKNYVCNLPVEWRGSILKSYVCGGRAKRGSPLIFFIFWASHTQSPLHFRILKICGPFCLVTTHFSFWVRCWSSKLKFHEKYLKTLIFLWPSQHETFKSYWRNWILSLLPM